MFPLIINTYPENGSDNVGLNDIIKITFDGELDPTTVTIDNVKLENYNIGQEVSITLATADANNSIVITPQSAYSGMTEYRLLISGLESVYGESMDGTFQVRFTTIGSLIEDVIEDPAISTFFEVLRTYPKENSVITPSVIKIQCSDTIDSSTDTSGIMLVADNFISDIEDALFMGENLIQAADISVSGNIISITPPSTLASGTKHHVVITKVTNLGGEQIIPFMSSFVTSYSPLYSTIVEIKSSEAIKWVTSKMSDTDVLLKAHQNSKLAVFIATEAENDEIDWSSTELPMYVYEYVKTKTQYDLIFDTVIAMSSSATTKQLKDLLIDYRFSLNDLLKLAKELELQYKVWQDYLEGHRNRGNAKAVGFVKGENADEVPDFFDRKFKDWDGTKTW